MERLHFARIDLTVVVRQSLHAVQSAVAERNQHVCVSLPPAPCYIRGNPARLQQVFVILLASASRFSRQGGSIWLSVDAISSSEHVGEVRTRIRDEGTGIAASTQPNIPALRLALVQQVVELHGGQVRARCNSARDGSEFTVMLPLLDTPVIPYRLQA